MLSSTSQPPRSESPSGQNSSPFSPERLPLDEAPTTLEEAVQMLRERPTEDLRRARKHHRRALKALREGTYDALGEETRERLIGRFHANLEALNRALDTEPSATPSTSQENNAQSLLGKALTWFQ